MGGGSSTPTAVRPLVKLERKAPRPQTSPVEESSPVAVAVWELYDTVEHRWTHMHVSNAELLEKAQGDSKDSATILLGPTRNLLFTVNLKSMKIDKTGQQVRRVVVTAGGMNYEHGTPVIESRSASSITDSAEQNAKAFRNRRVLKHDDKMYTGRIAPGGAVAVTGGASRALHLWDCESASLIQIHPMDGQVLSLDFSPVHAVLCATTDSCTVNFMDYTGNVLNARGRDCENHQSRVYCVRFFQEDFSDKLISSDLSGLVCAWDVQTMQIINKTSFTKVPVYTLSTARGGLYASGCDDGIVRLNDFRSGQVTQQLLGHTATVWGVDFNAENNLVVSCGMDHSCRVWDLRTMSCISIFEGHQERVHHACFTHGSRVLSAGRDSRGIVWSYDAVGGLSTAPQIVGVLKHQGYVTHAHYEADSRRVLTVSFDRTATLAELAE